MPKEYDTTNAPNAANVQIALCNNPDCGRLHLILVNADDEVIATATPGRNEDLLELLVQAKNLMLQIEENNK